jgi:hypothetical protein
VAGEGTLLQTFFSRLGFEVDTKGLDQYQEKLVGLSKSLLAFSGVTALSVGGLFALTKEATAPLAEIQRISDTYGIATEAIATYNRMGREFGITTESMTGSLVTLQKVIQAVAIGQGRFATKALQQYGISVKDATGSVKDMRTFLGDVAERMTTMTAGERNLLATRLGIDPNMIRMLRNGRDEFTRLYDEANKGLPFKKEDYEKAEQFEIAFKKAKAALGTITASIGLSLMPLFQKAMTSFLTWWHQNGEVVMQRIKFWVGLFASSAENVLTFIGELTGKTNVLSTAMRLLGAAVAIVVGSQIASWAASAVSALAGLGSTISLLTKYYLGLATAQEEEAAAALLANIWIYAIIAAIALLAAAIYLIIDDYQAWKKGGDSLIGRFLEHFKSASEATKRFWFAVRDAVVSIWNFLKTLWGYAADALGEAWTNIIAAWKALWPILKPVLIGIGIAIGVLIAIVIGLVAIVVWAAAKLISLFAKITEVLYTMIYSPLDALNIAWAALQDWWNKAVAFFLDVVPQLAHAVAEIFLNLFNVIGQLWMDSIGHWILKAVGFVKGIAGKVKAFFGFGEGEEKPIDADKAAEEAKKAWDEKMRAAGKEGEAARLARERTELPPAPRPPSVPPGVIPELPVTAPGAKVATGVQTLAARSIEQQRSEMLGRLPAAIPVQAKTVAAPTAAQALTTNRIDASQMNSNNTEVKATINVATPEEAGRASVALTKEGEKKKRQQQSARILQPIASH